ncbi:transposase [Ruficoccus amylovorans]|uniref:Transposase n=1 Tax=Ruficoccus amylovorans TaxID=1804625 RepID=A0A842HLH2_9BACT|nr:transposase [Ruficoccus amylovorans]
MFSAGGLPSLWVAPQHVWLPGEGCRALVGKVAWGFASQEQEYPELGYPKITRLLKRDGWDVGKRLVQRLRQEMGAHSWAALSRA